MSKTCISCKEPKHHAKGMCKRCYYREQYKLKPDQYKKYAKTKWKVHKEAYSLRWKDWYAKNKESVLERKRESYNPEVAKERYSKYRQENLHKERSRCTEYRKANPEYFKLSSKARNRRLKLATVFKSKEVKEALWEIYKNCPEGYHVDHIEPLHGKDVCGLHAPWNLQYLPAAENIRKGNRCQR